MTKRILLFGAGKSATVLIDFLLANAVLLDWQVKVADTDLPLITGKLNNHTSAIPVVIDIRQDDNRRMLIAEADLVISMMPPSLHFLIARDCLEFGKDLLTASYVDDSTRQLAAEIKDRGILFLCEMGLDPGIDHMSAKKIVDSMAQHDKRLISFKSHCGGLVSPESDDNPWHYKISWNPRNVVLAGKAGANYLEDGHLINLSYPEIFKSGRMVTSLDDSFETLAYYPNRNSLPYMELYQLSGLRTFIRTTLRHPAFMHGWQKLVEFGLTDDATQYATTDYNLKKFYRFFGAKNAIDWNTAFDRDPIFKEQMHAIGFDDESSIDKESVTAADVVQMGMEKNLMLQAHDKDMVVMVHEMDFEEEGIRKHLQSSLVVKGDNNRHTAMAKTVGLPLGIAAKLILSNQLKLTGLQIPVVKEIYLPVLEELEVNGIVFKDTTRVYN